MNSVRECLTFRLPMRHPGDTDAIAALLDDGRVRADEIVAIFGKTEGNGCVNDFTRPFAVEALKTLFADRLGIDRAAVLGRIGMVMSGGTEGGLSPHFLVFAVRRRDGIAGPAKRLAIGTAVTRAFRPEEIGRLPQVLETAAAIDRAMAEAGIRDRDDVHFVQIKCPLLTAEKHAEAASRGHTLVTGNTLTSMGYSRGASALGVGVALGEIAAAALSDEMICRDYAFWSGRASASAGIELMHNEVIVLGNSADWAGEAAIGHAVMRDAIDTTAVRDAMAAVGIELSLPLPPERQRALLAVLVKAEPSSGGRIRDLRHIMLDDSDFPATRHARALVGGVMAGLIGRTDLFVSGGAEHQGPDGGGPIAVIATQR